VVICVEYLVNCVLDSIAVVYDPRALICWLFNLAISHIKC